MSKEMAILNEGPKSKSKFVSLLREYHFSLFVLILLSYYLATAYFVDDPFMSYMFGVCCFGFMILYYIQFWIYIRAYIKKSFFYVPVYKKRV